jgi:tRNA threonylcarbamoyladenosine biosynthesis protein TsaB
MLVLALDTAMNACSVAVVDCGDGDARVLSRASEQMDRGHAEALLPMVAAAMGEAAISFSELSMVAVTVGPGTFTGARIGISAARGYALASDIPVVGVSTLQAVAMNAPRDEGRDIVVAFDAHRGEVYVQRFTGPDRHSLSAPQILPLAEACALLERRPVALIGSGAPLLLERLDDPAGTEILEASGLPDPVQVARLAAIRGLPPVPLYLRPPDAKPQAPQIIRAG